MELKNIGHRNVNTVSHSNYNWNNNVKQVDCMERMGQEIPATAQLIKTRKLEIKNNYTTLSVSYSFLEFLMIKCPTYQW